MLSRGAGASLIEIEIIKSDDDHPEVKVSEQYSVPKIRGVLTARQV